jgi:hypothetical protein
VAVGGWPGGRFLLTAVGLGLLLATATAIGGIYQGLVVEALSIVRAPGRRPVGRPGR